MEFDFSNLSGKELHEFPSASILYRRKWNKSGIYAITINNKVMYIGKSKNMGTRIQNHMSQLREQSQSEKKYKILDEARKAGLCITFEVVEYAAAENITEREAYYINYYLPPLNRQMPLHKDFPKHTSLLGNINNYKEAIELAKTFQGGTNYET